MTAPVLITDTWLLDDDVVIHRGDVLLHADGSWAPAAGDELVEDTVDGRSLLVTRSLQNWHTHLAMLLHRSLGEGLTLQDWLEHVIFPSEQRLTPELVAVGSRAAAAEMIRSGSSFACDMYYFPQVTAEVFADAGLRALITPAIVDFPTPAYPGGSAEILATLEDLLSGPPPVPGMVEYGIGTHSVYACGPETLRAARDLAERHSAHLHIHLSETETEVLDCRAAHGMSPVQFLDSLDFFLPGTVAAHCDWVDADDMAILAERGVRVVHCPCSNMKLASGRTMPVPDMARAGADIHIGTDGAASNNSLDMRNEAKFASLVQRHDYGEATLLNPESVWQLATKGSRDWVTWNLDDIRMRPIGSDGHRLVGNLVYSNTHCVDMWVAGRALRRDSVTLSVDEGAVMVELEAAAEAIIPGR